MHSDLLLTLLQSLIVDQIVTSLCLHVLVELVDKRTGSWDIILVDFPFIYSGHMFNDSSEAVAMSYDNHVLSGMNLRGDNVVPVREYAVGTHLQGLRGWQLSRWYRFVSWIENRMSRIVKIKFRRLNLVASSPHHSLLFTVLFSSFCFAKTLQCSVVALVESPRLMNRNIV